tara:strand:- start:2258 stop:4135 length:1878 start_codon:yes stop_codon:yes gene_type:complete
MAQKTLSVKLSLNDKQFQSSLKKATRSMKKFGQSMQRTGQTLSRNLTLPIVALGAASVKAFDTQQKAIAQVESGLRSTGEAAGFTSQQLQKMASDLQGKTLFGDEVILKDATAQLLTFTNIAGEQFERTQIAALNLATRLDGDLKSASIQLGKALNNPVTNLSALKRSGIEFSDAQIETIKSLAQTNRLAEAQTIILDELEKQYGGAAEAARLAGLGPFQALQMVLSDLSEEFGALIMENLEPFRAKVEQIVKFLQNLTDEQRRALVSFAGYAAVIGPALIIVGKLVTSIGGLINSLRKLSLFIATNPFTLLATAVAGLVSIMGFAILDTEKFIKTALEMGKVGKFIAKVVLAALSAINPKYAAYFAVLDDVSEGLEEQEKNLKDSTKEVNANKKAVDKLTKSIQNLSIETDKGVNIKVTKSFEQISTELDSIELGEIGEEEQLEKLSFDTEDVANKFLNLQSVTEEMNRSFESFGRILQGTFAQALQSSDGFFKTFVAGAKMAMSSLLAQLAATAALNALLGGSKLGGALGFKSIGGLGGIVKGIGGLLGFAEGGMVTGATLAMVGEGPGTSMSNPEVIAPLDKLKSMMGQGGNSVEVFGTISGADILLSSDRARNNRTKTRGY